MEKITMAELTALFDSVAAIMAENAERLCAMDANMGDGDLGLTMKKGFGALPGLIADIDEADLGKRLAQQLLRQLESPNECHEVVLIQPKVVYRRSTEF